MFLGRDLPTLLTVFLVSVSTVAAFEPAMVPEASPVPSFQVSILEGVVGSEPSGRGPTLEGITRGNLWLRLSPPPRGRHARLPSLRSEHHGDVIQVFEVPPQLQAPRLPPRGVANLGPIHLVGEYDVVVALEGIEPETFRLRLQEDFIELRAMDPKGLLQVASRRLARLPHGTFSYRFDHPHCQMNRSMARRLWRQLLDEEPKIGAHPVVSGLLWPSTPVSDPGFLDWAEGGEPIMLALEPARVLDLLHGMARDTCANLQVRWYGGPLWDTRDIRRVVLPNPHWLANLELPRGGPYRPDVLSPDRDGPAHRRWPVDARFGAFHGLKGATPRPPGPRRTSVFSPDVDRNPEESVLELSDDDLDLELDP